MDSLRRSLHPRFFALKSCSGPRFFPAPRPRSARAFWRSFSLCTGLLPALGSRAPAAGQGTPALGHAARLFRAAAAGSCSGSSCCPGRRSAAFRRRSRRSGAWEYPSGNLLAWQTAAQSEGRARKVLEGWPPVLCGALLLALVPCPWAGALGALLARIRPCRASARQETKLAPPSRRRTAVSARRGGKRSGPTLPSSAPQRTTTSARQLAGAAPDGARPPQHDH